MWVMSMRWIHWVSYSSKQTLRSDFIPGIGNCKKTGTDLWGFQAIVMEIHLEIMTVMVTSYRPKYSECQTKSFTYSVEIYEIIVYHHRYFMLRLSFLNPHLSVKSLENWQKYAMPPWPPSGVAGYVFRSKWFSLLSHCQVSHPQRMRTLKCW